MLWPGTYSIATNRMPKGGVPMFGLLALAGDLGCLTGPYLTGMMSTAFGGNLKAGFLFSLIFPITLMVMVFILMKYFKKPEKTDNN